MAMETWIDSLLATLALPDVGLPTVFVVSLLSATLLPLGSEPAVFGYIKLNPDMFWVTIAVATAGNSIGGAIDWWLGYAAKLAVVRYRQQRQARLHAMEHALHVPHPPRHRKPALNRRYFRWMRRLGPPALLFSWLPAIGDPLCAVAGWLRLPFWPSLVYMTIGKLLRYLTMTAALLWVPNSFWEALLTPFRGWF